MPEETTSSTYESGFAKQNSTMKDQASEQGKNGTEKLARSYVPPHLRRQMEQQLRTGSTTTDRSRSSVGNGLPDGRAAGSSSFFKSGSGATKSAGAFGGGAFGSRERGAGGEAAATAGRRWGASATASASASSRTQRLGLWEDTNPYYSSGVGKPAELGAGSADVNGEVLELFNGQNTGINFDKYDDIPVEVSGENVVPEIMSFETSGMDKILLRNVALSGYRKPTPVQRHAIPTVMSGRDLMSCAQTGSGKTAAFVLPVLHQMLLMGGPAPAPSSGPSSGHSSRFRCSYPTYLILAPTRELASQIFSECRKFCYGTGIRAAVIYGGSENTREQLRAIENQVDIVVATPGRLLDFIERGRIHLANVRFLTLDEADRMLDMGFEPQIRQIVETCDMPVVGERQTLMFSATFPREIQRLAADFLHSYIFLAVGRVGSTTDFIVQRIEFCEDHLKREMLLDLLNSIPGLTLVFVDTKRAADALEDFLLRHGYAASSIHGDRSQREREDSLAAFRSGQTPILVATDVAARGLDIPNVAHVINYELPAAIDDYVHRIGRTGRAGNQGIATSFANEKNRGIVRDLIELLQEAGQEVPSWLYTMCQGPMARSGGGSGRPGRGGRFGARDMRRESGGPRRSQFGGPASATAGTRDEPWGGGNWRASGGSAW